MPYNPRLTSPEWTLLRGQWQAGQHNNRQLAAIWPVTEGAIRRRARLEHWTRLDPAVLAARQHRHRARKTQRAAESPQATPESTQGCTTMCAPRTGEREAAYIAGPAAAQAAVRPELIAPAVDTLDQHNAEHLVALRTTTAIADRLGTLILDALCMDEDPASVARSIRATAKLLLGRNDSLCGQIATYVKLLDTKQVHSRRALGAADGKKPVQPTGADGGPAASEHVGKLDFEAMSTDKLKLLLELVAETKQSRAVAEPPMPPVDPGRKAH